MYSKCNKSGRFTVFVTCELERKFYSKGDSKYLVDGGINVNGCKNYRILFLSMFSSPVDSLSETAAGWKPQIWVSTDAKHCEMPLLQN